MQESWATQVPGPALSRELAKSGRPGPRPLPHHGRPRLQTVNLVPSPTGRSHRLLLERPQAWGTWEVMN